MEAMPPKTWRRLVDLNLTIVPDGFLTDANRRWFCERPAFQKEFEALIPMGRLGEPDELGPLAVYLASEASRYMTGALLVIDGGSRCGEQPRELTGLGHAARRESRWLTVRGGGDGP